MNLPRLIRYGKILFDNFAILVGVNPPKFNAGGLMKFNFVFAHKRAGRVALDQQKNIV